MQTSEFLTQDRSAALYLLASKFEERRHAQRKKLPEELLSTAYLLLKRLIERFGAQPGLRFVSFREDLIDVRFTDLEGRERGVVGSFAPDPDYGDERLLLQTVEW